MNRKCFKLDNRGSGIVTVMVAVMFLTVFGSLLLMTSLTNFEMKTSERIGRQNLYDAETAMAEIHTGFQEVASDSMDSALKLALIEYGSKSETDAQNAFAQQFAFGINNWYVIDNTGNQMKLLTADNATTYRSEALCYLIKNCRDAGKVYIITGDQAYKDYDTRENAKVIKYKNNDTSSHDNGLVYLMYDADCGLPTVKYVRSTVVDAGVTKQVLEKATFKNICVVYEYNGRSTTLKTDISVIVPEIGYSVNSSGSQDITEFAFVAGGNLVHEMNNSNVFINGNSYMNAIKTSGSGLITFGDTDSTSTTSKSRVIVRDAINVHGNSMTADRILFNEYTELWTNDIIVNDSSRISLLGSTNVADDLELNGYNSAANLGGSYFGFGTSLENSSSSSSIIANGLSSELILSDIKKLSLAGYSFVGASAASPSVNDTKMAESISVKENQSVYLVDPEYLYYNNGTMEKKLKSNPMVFSDENAIINNVQLDKDFTMAGTDPETGNVKSYKFADYGAYVKQAVIPYGSQFISYYFIAFSDTEHEVIKKVDNGDGTSSNKTVTEPFYSAEENANRYFKDYYSNHPKKINAFVQKYLKTSGTIRSIENVGGWARFFEYSLNGSITTKNEFINYLSNSSAETLKSEALSCSTKFANYIKFLEPVTPDGYEEIFNNTEGTYTDYNPFDYYVDKNAIVVGEPITIGEDVVDSKIESGTAKYFYKCDAYGKSSTKYNNKDAYKFAVISNGDFTYSATTDPNKTIGLIVCVGNLEITQDFEGVIFCSGNITINANNVSIKKNEKKLISCYSSINSDGTTPGVYFNIPLCTTVTWGDDTIEDNGSPTISAYVKYENWTKS